ncbi:MAG: rod shape-determining protein RodA [Spirobacillus cienkowskii]|jgi:rod shape determining protein RodA|uniref:Rod shape-determining protein RodA n=1 Tax=Spirobacillus cienkowskii TaxID=495820 RepID=A0A369KLU1_9BACT|nr:MAG: rod shape-determining protein RodA [Spirobacillus cienkowskii]
MVFLSFLKDKFKGTPWGIVLTAYSIIFIGLYNLYSATNAAYTPARFYDQMIFVLLGTLAAIFWGIMLDLKNIERLTILGYVIVCLMLLAVDIFGRSAKGAERWLVLGTIRIQPSEFAKLMIILIVARSFNLMKGFSDFTLTSLWRQIFYVGIPFVLILLQPDLGTASLVLLIASLQISTIKIRGKSLLYVFAITLTLAVIAWNFILYDYQKQRVLTFINPMLDPRGSGYHSIQSMIAVGSGGMWGQGFSQGTQAQLNFLPERHTDFAFSVWAEEHGFLGCLLLIFLFVVLIIQIFQTADRARDSFSALAAVGVGGFFLFHFVINISMVLGVFPVVGVPLTFFSYGGTHMVTALSCIGIVVAIERKRYLSTTSF